MLQLQRARSSGEISDNISIEQSCITVQLKHWWIWNLPLRQVSGESLTIKVRGVLNLIDEEKVIMECLMCLLQRAGAGIILTYFALHAARSFCGEEMEMEWQSLKLLWTNLLYSLKNLVET
ncbi:uncharacterized protein LOC120075681 [Benincasa hispida]|uniref:uncharacterized protein LOC120075681 n=1 Tax=Benincasa hispida TaxID=102211 RepID=UPI0018FF2CD9|nr:uncharacterized protein LOC120075681 [Benincasa hispida]